MLNKGVRGVELCGTVDLSHRHSEPIHNVFEKENLIIPIFDEGYQNFYGPYIAVD